MAIFGESAGIEQRRKRISDEIAEFRRRDMGGILVKTFTEKYDYDFARAMWEAVDGAVILFDKKNNHYVCKVDDTCYDVTGPVSVLEDNCEPNILGVRDLDDGKELPDAVYTDDTRPKDHKEILTIITKFRIFDNSPNKKVMNDIFRDKYSEEFTKMLWRNCPGSTVHIINGEYKLKNNDKYYDINGPVEVKDDDIIYDSDLGRCKAVH